MARGPLPDPDRQRRNAPTVESTELGSKPVKSELVPKIPRREWQKLHKETRAWWNDVVAAPQASQFGLTDWRRLRMVVLPLVERFNLALNPPKGEDIDDVKVDRLARSVAAQEKEFGLTPEARQRMRWVYRPKPEATSPEETEGKTAKRKPQTVRTDPRLKLVEGDKG